MAKTLSRILGSFMCRSQRANYAHCRYRGCFYGAQEMTLRALVGLAVREDLAVSLPPRLDPMRLNATNEAAPMSILIEDAVREVLSMGRFGILLYFPAEGNTANSVPHISTFKVETIEDFDTACVDGNKMLSLVWRAGRPCKAAQGPRSG